MNVEQKARFDAIKAEIEITMDAINDGELNLGDLNRLIESWPSSSIQHAAYTTCRALIQD